VPDAAFTVTATCVVPAAAMLVGVAATEVVVATAGEVMVKLAVPEELPKFPVAVKVAVRVSAPVLRLLPLTVKVATPAESVADPSEVEPADNATLPVGAAVPDAAFTVTVTWVVPDVASVAELTATDVVVAIGAVEVTVTLTLPEELAKLPIAVYAAVSVLAPTARLPPFTVNDATPDESVADPRDAAPADNATLPVGTVVPEAAFTVTVI
jgi:hypothetical protein